MKTFIIPVIVKNDLTKRLDKLAKKAAAYKCNFSYTFGNEAAVTRNVYTVCDNVKTRTGSETVFGIELTIDSDIIRKNGYRIIAGINHDPAGNIVTVFDETIKTDPAWYTMPAKCDHCGTRHAKKNTFIVRDAAGHDHQIGRSCLKDYSGINPEMIAAYQEISDMIVNEYDIDEYDFTGTGDYAYDVIDVVALANDMISAYGYVKSQENMSTKDRILTGIRKADPDKNSVALANDMREYFSRVDYTQLTDYLRNVKSLFAAGYVREKDFGYLAYAPIAYKKMIEKDHARETNNGGAYVGNVGDRVTIDVKQTKLITSWESIYGMTWLYKFTTNDGNTIVWYASKTITGDPKKITGTVKEHKDYDGEKQTVITRCRVS